MSDDNEFAEFDTTEDEFDAMMAAGQPVEVVGPAAERLEPAHGLYSLVTGPPENFSPSESIELVAVATRSAARTSIVAQRDLVSS